MSRNSEKISEFLKETYPYRMKKGKTEVVKMQQICVGQFEIKNRDNPKELIKNYSILGLGIDGNVYRFDTGCQGWFPLNMSVVACSHRR